MANLNNYSWKNKETSQKKYDTDNSYSFDSDTSTFSIADDIRSARRYSELGKFYCRRGERGLAEKFFIKMLEVYKEKSDERPEDTERLSELANGYHKLAEFYTRCCKKSEQHSDFEKSEEYYAHELETRQKILLLLYTDENIRSLANCRNEIGLFYYDTNNYEKSLEHLLKASEILTELAERTSNWYDVILAHIYNNAGLVYDELDNKELAEKCYLSAIGIYEQLLEKSDEVCEFSLVKSYRNIISLYNKHDELSKGEKYIPDMLELFDKLSDKAPQKYLDEYIRVIGMIANIYEEADNIVKAEEYYELYVKQKKKKVDMTQDTEGILDLANCCNSFGLMCYNDERCESGKAMKYYSTAVELLERIIKTPYDEANITAAHIYNNMGLIFRHDQKDTKLAEECYLKAIEIYKRLLLSFREKCIENLDKTYGNLVYMFTEADDVENAEKYYPGMVEFLTESAKLEPQEYLLKLADVYADIGKMYERAGDWEQSMLFHNLEIDANKKLVEFSDSIKNLWCLMASCHNFGTAILRLDADNEEGLEYYQKAVEILELILSKDPDFLDPGMGIVYYNVGKQYYYEQDVEKAEEYLLKAAEVYQKYDNKYRDALLEIYRRLIKIYQCNGDLESLENYTDMLSSLNEHDEDELV